MSSTPLVLHAPPAAGFDEPFEMLDACHRRVERMLALLERLAAHLASHGCDAAAADAARDVMRYFDLAAPQHHEDEERHVLPALRAAGAAALADRLQAEHAAMALAWAALRVPLAAIAAGRAPGGDGLAGGPAFAAMYGAHLALEDAEAFPAVRPHLDAGALAVIGAEMAQRRGVPLPAGGGPGRR